VWDRPGGPEIDPWAWLRDRDDPRTVAYLEAENDYTAAWTEECNLIALVGHSSRIYPINFAVTGQTGAAAAPATAAV